MSSFKYVSLFSGIGGFEQALNDVGGECVFASEIDKFAAKSYEVLYGHKPHGDITEIDAKDIPDHDILVGGFPCQAFSVAGQRKGFEDTRGTLFFEVARIASEKQPNVLLLENVKGLVGHDKGKTLDTIVKTLNNIGYCVDFEVLNSKFFGVPQNRERIFIVAVRDDLVENEAWTNIKGVTVVPKGKRRISGYIGEDDWKLKTFNFDFPANDKVTTRLRDILETDVDEKYYLDEEKTAKLIAQLEETTGKGIDDVIDDKVIQQAESGVRLREESGTLRQCLNHQHIIEQGIDNCDSVLKQYNKFAEREGYIPELFNPYNNSEIKDVAPTQSAQCSRVNNSSTVLKIEPQMLGHIDIKGHDSLKRVYSVESVGPTLTTMGGGNSEPKIAESQTCIDDTQGFDGIRLYDDEAPTIRSNRHGLKIVEEQGLPIREATKKGYAIAEEGDSVNVQFPDSKTRHGVALREIIEENVREIASKSRPNEEIEINFKENGDIRPHRTDTRKSGLSELNINHEDNPSFTVSAAHSPKVYGNKTRYRIRKLTPLECWRLQGFSDEAHEAVKQAGLSDSQRYKQAGNAVTVNVIRELVKGIEKYINEEDDE